MEIAVEVRDLTKIFGRKIAVNKISFEVEKGEIFGLIGPNGAGKTTTLRILATILKPTAGTAKIFGLDVVKDADMVRKMISYLPEEAGVYKNLTGLEYLRFMASFHSSSEEEVQRMVDEAAEISGLGDRLHDKTKTYSKGMKRRLLVARALMAKSPLVILDEPTSGLDVMHAVHIRDIIRNYAHKYGMTVLLSSHNMLEVEYLCDRIAIIDRGKIVLEGGPSELKEKFGVSNLEELFVRVVRGA
ncbi:MAG: ABC transporter ATP-binding protein [Candidatus Baldrarchaeia archaeon]